MMGHGSRLLGLVRAGAYSLYGAKARYPLSGTDQVYGLAMARFLADHDDPDQLVLSLYGMLGAAMTPDTFVSGEAATVAPLRGAAYRSMYLPPNAASNSAFLETLRVMLVHETTQDGRATGLELAFGTPRAWLATGRVGRRARGADELRPGLVRDRRRRRPDHGDGDRAVAPSARLAEAAAPRAAERAHPCGARGRQATPVRPHDLDGRPLRPARDAVRRSRAGQVDHYVMESAQASDTTLAAGGGLRETGLVARAAAGALVPAARALT